jgi:hypothetical protein
MADDEVEVGSVLLDGEAEEGRGGKHMPQG